MWFIIEIVHYRIWYNTNSITLKYIISIRDSREKKTWFFFTKDNIKILGEQAPFTLFLILRSVAKCRFFYITCFFLGLIDFFLNLQQVLPFQECFAALLPCNTLLCSIHLTLETCLCFVCICFMKWRTWRFCVAHVRCGLIRTIYLKKWRKAD